MRSPPLNVLTLTKCLHLDRYSRRPSVLISSKKKPCIPSRGVAFLFWMWVVVVSEPIWAQVSTTLEAFPPLAVAQPPIRITFPAAREYRAAVDLPKLVCAVIVSGLSGLLRWLKYQIIQYLIPRCQRPTGIAGPQPIFMCTPCKNISGAELSRTILITRVPTWNTWKPKTKARTYYVLS